MAYEGEAFISKVLDTGDVNAFSRFGIREETFITDTEKAAYRFIADYAEQNHGEVPDPRTVEAEIDGFVYMPQIQDTFKSLGGRLKEEAGAQAVLDLWNSKEVADLFSGAPTTEFIEYVMRRLIDISDDIAAGNQSGFDIKRDIERFKSEYRRRKEGKSFKMYESLFPSIGDAIGNYLSGNTYAWFGRSGRGKSIFVMMEAIHAARNGANVLIWSLEMSWYELMARLISALSAFEGMLTITTEDGVRMQGGFSPKDLLRGKLSDYEEATLDVFFEELSEKLPGNIKIRSIDDETFTRRDARQLEADIKTYNADVVVIDPIYYMTMEKNTGKTTGGDVAKTSQKLRAIAGRNSVVMHVITQAEEVRDAKTKEGERVLRLPYREEVKKASQILEDASALIGIDTLDGRGLISIGKGRTGGEDLIVEVMFLPSYGLIREISGADADIFSF